MTTRRDFLRAGGLGVGAVLAGCADLTGSMNEGEDDRPIQAHRCFADDNPENTRLAAEEAVAVADQLEFDVRRCGSGEIVVFHDERVNGKTDGSGTVSELSLDELKELRVLDSDETIPTLSEMLDVIPADVAVNIELKEHDLVEDIVDVIEGYDHRTIISAIQPTMVQQADQVREDDEYEVALVGVSNPARALETAVAMNCDRIHFGYHDLIETNALQAAKEAGLWVNTGTLAGPNQYRITREMDVDGFSGDSASTFEDVEPLD